MVLRIPNLVSRSWTTTSLESLFSIAARESKEVVVHDLDTKFGMRKTIGYAKVYESPEHAQDVEQDYMLERNKITAEEDADGEPEEA